jgi:hypothetical protein
MQLPNDLKEKRGYWNLKEEGHLTALCAEFVFEEAMDVS